jgi:hypothetical protein
MSTAITMLLDQILTPWAETLTRDSAERTLRFQLDPQTLRRIDDLADRAAEGALTESEKNEYEELVDAIDLLGILKAKARDALAKRVQP